MEKCTLFLYYYLVSLIQPMSYGLQAGLMSILHINVKSTTIMELDKVGIRAVPIQHDEYTT